MEEAARLPLAAWETFYVIVGSSGAALTGLQFVVIALVAESRMAGGAREIDAFGTPTIVHFCSVLLLSAILTAPWRGLASVSGALGIIGLAGVIYGLIVVRRARRQTGYKPVFEDWLWHTVLPLIAYALLLIAGFFLRSYPRRVLFIVAATALLLLFIGIHNAWDTVTYIAVEHMQKGKDADEAGPTKSDE
jgi:L-asparagine transporter-like permease